MRRLILRLVGLTYLLAYTSLWTQLDGLVGSEGILPAADYLARVEARLGAARLYRLPTLFWLSSADWMLHLVCGVGTLLSLLLLVGIAPLPSALLLWMGYLSLCGVGQIFLGYQWDSLLLEVGFLAIFLSPPGWRPDWRRRPSRAVIWLLRLLLFRLMFGSGMVKLTSGDPTWADLSALSYHYWTQPLPTPLAWVAYQLPGWAHRVGTALVLASELLLPWLIFGPRPLRLLAAGLLSALLLLIAATGNYGFFQLLSLAVCLSLIDDAALRRIWPRPLEEVAPVDVGPRWLRWGVAGTLCLAVGFMSAYQLSRLPARPPRWPARARRLVGVLGAFHSVNFYGLFARMTTTRREIVVQGSRDGERWVDYPFRYKPQSTAHSPRWVAPHQPRLDWQMWFAPLRRRPPRWFARFCQRLLEGAPPVTGLLAGNPFPDRPPRFIRAVYYEYRFTDREERSRSGNWWARGARGIYLEPIQLPASKD